MTEFDGSPSEKRYPMPFTRVELVVMGLVDGGLAVLLARRREAPYAGRWALPGGVLRIDLDTSLEQAARRVLRERLGLAAAPLRQLCASGGPRRDPRAPWTLSVVYRALVIPREFAPVTGKRVEALDWRNATEATADRSLAFDHADIIQRALESTRSEVDALALPYGLLPSPFTLAELQTACEQVLGRSLDKSSFRRRLKDVPRLEPVKGAARRGAFRPAQLYRATGVDTTGSPLDPDSHRHRR